MSREKQSQVEKGKERPSGSNSSLIQALFCSMSQLQVWTVLKLFKSSNYSSNLPEEVKRSFRPSISQVQNRSSNLTVSCSCLMVIAFIRVKPNKALGILEIWGLGCLRFLIRLIHIWGFWPLTTPKRKKTLINSISSAERTTTNKDTTSTPKTEASS